MDERPAGPLVRVGLRSGWTNRRTRFHQAANGGQLPVEVHRAALASAGRVAPNWELALTAAPIARLCRAPERSVTL